MVKSSTQKNTGVENFRPKKIRRTPRHVYTRVSPLGFAHGILISLNISAF